MSVADTGPLATRAFRAMGCQVVLTLATPSAARAEPAFDAAQRTIGQAERCLSRFRPDSELARLNARAGSWTTVSPLLADVLGASLQAARRTGGLCTPTILAALEAAGYDRDFAQLRRSPAVPDPSAGGVLAVADRSGRPPHVALRQLRPAGVAGRPRHAWRGVHLDLATGRARLPAGVRLDLAGVAKGWTADRVAEILAPVGPCLVDMGGDLVGRGAPPGLAGWPVAVADPADPDANLALVLLRNAAIATSGTDFRRWSHRGGVAHHLIDPRTGAPSRTDVWTASVIAQTALAADVHTKTALLLGLRDGTAYLARRGLAGLLVGRRRRLLTTTTQRWSHHACLD
jgi:thiamine biosynthesis lipoprotein